MGQTNIDPKVVEGFGQEWDHFNHGKIQQSELQSVFQTYFSIFPWDKLPESGGIGADVGCGTGRWSIPVAAEVQELHLVDASEKALAVAKKNLAQFSNVKFTQASVGDLPFENESLDFAYSLGVLHHIPDTEAGIRSISEKLKPGAPFLVYLYYAFDNQPGWYALLWKLSDFFSSWNFYAALFSPHCSDGSHCGFHIFSIVQNGFDIGKIKMPSEVVASQYLSTSFVLFSPYGRS